MFYIRTFLSFFFFFFSLSSLLSSRGVYNFHLLSVFAGTGYLTACFAQMVGPQGRVVGVEHIPELVSLAIENIQKSAAATLLKDGSLSVHAGGMISKISVNLKD